MRIIRTVNCYPVEFKKWRCCFETILVLRKTYKNKPMLQVISKVLVKLSGAKSQWIHVNCGLPFKCTPKDSLCFYLSNKNIILGFHSYPLITGWSRVSSPLIVSYGLTSLSVHIIRKIPSHSGQFSPQRHQSQTNHCLCFWILVVSNCHKHCYQVFWWRHSWSYNIVTEMSKKFHNTNHTWNIYFSWSD